MKFKFVLLILISMLPGLTKAQLWNLDATKTKALMRMVSADKNIAEVYQKWMILADQSLKDSPNPIDTITSEGHLISHPKKQLTIKSFKDFNKIYALALAYKVTGRKPYLNKSTAFILAWAKVNRPTGNPINDTKLDLLFEGYDLIKGEINDQSNIIIKLWLMEVADQEILSLKDNYNNWNSHRIKIVAQIGFMLDEKRYVNFAEDNLKIQIAKNLEPNGQSIDFKKRDALHYHTFTLEPLLKTAILFKLAGKENYLDYVSPTGSSIRKSVAFLTPYAIGELKHQEFVNSTVKIDRDRAAQKEPGFSIGTDFLRVKTLTVYILASYFDPNYSSIYKSLLGLPPVAAADQLIIDNSLYEQWLPILIQLR
jgi:hypothetical protein